ncbi:SDR family oxidoreductase [Luteibacter sp. 3190]|uniref:SDR family oxidoreductase n=1 Tax=Luteibacter sp. 3190 TaxID=2817736 RepID=UPI00285E913B|nr:SDR family oxidoreductase [Luteibacter sp. 3190]MDR6935384.1 uncharacterized protein YbjT (DUF2867 family) [Luteibacter sp. 3190]
MKILVIGGTGLIGSKVVDRLRDAGHDVTPAAPSTGVNTLTGEGLDASMAGVDTVVDLSNSPSFAKDDVIAFFTTAGRNIAEAEKKAGVTHHVALSVVGTDDLDRLGSGYFAGKVAQEKLIRAAGVPYTIVHSTQFMEFLPGIVASGEKGADVHMPTADIQPIASDDVARLVADATLEPPTTQVVEIAGPARFSMADLVATYLTKTGDARRVIGSAETPYFGAVLDRDTLVPRGAARLGRIGFDEWFAARTPAAAA